MVLAKDKACAKQGRLHWVSVVMCMLAAHLDVARQPTLQLLPAGKGTTAANERGLRGRD